jgi:hypothetical protein
MNKNGSFTRHFHQWVTVGDNSAAMAAARSLIAPLLSA